MGNPKEENRINIFYTDRSYRLSRRVILDLFDRVLNNENRAGSLVNLVFVNESAIMKLNRDYRGENRITDVLSFDFDDELLGEIYICLAQARRQAKDRRTPVKIEIMRLLIHGLLHLLGYDHTDKKEELEMYARQESYLEMVSRS